MPAGSESDEVASGPGQGGIVFSADEMAIVVYEAIRGYNHVIGDPWLDPPWPGALPFHRGAAYNGVLAVLAGKDPRQLHEAWCAYYAAAGWEHGPAKDAWATPRPTHPSLVSWDKLPPAEQVKYELFAGVVLAMTRIGTGDEN
jgi:hypothetical protein